MPNAEMIWNFKLMAAVTVVIVATVFLTYADIEEFMVTFLKRKTVATSYLTLERFSKVQCAEKCYKEGKQGRCRIAGYNKDTKTCRLSMDSQQDVLDFPDDSSGVFIYQQEPVVTTQGIVGNNATMQLCHRNLRLCCNSVWFMLHKHNV